MKLCKRIIACLSAFVIATGGASLSVYAENKTDTPIIGSDSAIVDMNEYREYLDTLTDEQRQIVDAKQQILANMESAPSDGLYTASRAASLIGLPGTFTIYQQETDTYCIPACIKSALLYIRGISSNQSGIDSEINENFAKIPGYLNERQDKCTYSLTPVSSQSVLTGAIKYDITVCEVPAFLRLSGTKSSTWYYTTYGHCVISNGIYDDLSIILIADPLGERIADCPYFYRKAASEVAAYTTHVVW